MAAFLMRSRLDYRLIEVGVGYEIERLWYLELRFCLKHRSVFNKIIPVAEAGSA